MNPIRESMQPLMRHNGIWEGTYRLVDREGTLLDLHQSRIEVRFPDEGEFHYVQRNYFRWADGREVRGEYPGVCRNGMLYWDNALIHGHAWVIDEYSAALTWRRHDTPGAYLYEMIVINEANNKRGRTWHWFRDGELFQRTLIDEIRVSD